MVSSNPVWRLRWADFHFGVNILVVRNPESSAELSLRGCVMLELGATALAVHRVVRVLGRTASTDVSDNRHSRYGECLPISFVEVERVALVAPESRDMVLLERPFSLRRAGN